MDNVARPWMLAYTIVYGLLSISFVRNDIENQYNMACIIEGACVFVLIFVGNLIYSLDLTTPKIRKIWKFVFPIIILDSIVWTIVDLICGKHAQNASVELKAIATTIDYATFFPTLWAHYKIGYGKELSDDVA